MKRKREVEWAELPKDLAQLVSTYLPMKDAAEIRRVHRSFQSMSWEPWIDAYDKAWELWGDRVVYYDRFLRDSHALVGFIHVYKHERAHRVCMKRAADHIDFWHHMKRLNQLGIQLWAPCAKDWIDHGTSVNYDHCALFFETKCLFAVAYTKDLSLVTHLMSKYPFNNSRWVRNTTFFSKFLRKGMIDVCNAVYDGIADQDDLKNADWRWTWQDIVTSTDNPDVLRKAVQWLRDHECGASSCSVVGAPQSNALIAVEVVGKDCLRICMKCTTMSIVIGHNGFGWRKVKGVWTCTSCCEYI